MLFEEFFKKKKINLDALQQGDKGLFSEFKEHYEQMGEKSFDHTKKFWFNKLRRQYPLPPEVKAEKLRAENQIAEQTVSDTLTEPSPRNEAPKLGFKPKFNTTGKEETAPSTEAPATPPVTNIAADSTTEQSAPKPAYKPRFQAKSIIPKPATEEEQANAVPAEPAAQPKAESTETKITDEAANTPAKPGFKPRFKAGITTSQPADEQPATTHASEPTATSATEANTTTPQEAPAKLGFKPRFKAGVTTSKPVEELTEPATVEPEKTNTPEADQTEEQEPTKTDEQPTPAKLGFKPRFKAGVTTTKPAEDEQAPAQSLEATKEELPANDSPEATPPTIDTPKPAYKPRFNPKMIKPKPPEEGTEE